MPTNKRKIQDLDLDSISCKLFGFVGLPQGRGVCRRRGTGRGEAIHVGEMSDRRDPSVRTEQKPLADQEPYSLIIRLVLFFFPIGP